MTDSGADAVLDALGAIIAGDQELVDLVGRRLAFLPSLRSVVGLELPLVTAVVTPAAKRGDGSRFLILQLTVIDAPAMGRDSGDFEGSMSERIAGRLVQFLSASNFAAEGVSVRIQEVRAIAVQPAERADLQAVLELLA